MQLKEKLQGNYVMEVGGERKLIPLLSFNQMFKDDLVLRLLLYFSILAIDKDVKFAFKVDVLVLACVVVVQKHNIAFSETYTLTLLKSVCLENK
jgi:hypothetical protein